jgi:hypothetical protein
MLSSHAKLPAATFFHWRRGDVATSDLSTTLTSLIKPALFVVHIRYHWIATQLTPTQWVIWDSAPSRPVKADLIRDSKRLGLPTPTFRPAPQQRNGSMECGLFAIAFTLMVHAGYDIPHPSGYTDFSPLRQYIRVGAAAAPDMLAHALKILGVEQKSPEHPKQWRHNPYERQQEYDSTKDACGGTEPPEPETVKCTAQKQQKRGGGQCAAPSVTTTGTPLCRFHVLQSNTSSSKCTAKSAATKKACPHKAVERLNTCPFHTKDNEFHEWLAQWEAAKIEERQPLPNHETTNHELFEALALVNDPDVENEVYAAHQEIAQWNPQQQRPRHSFSQNASLSDLRTHIKSGTTSDACHPLAKLAWNKSTLAGHARALRRLTDSVAPAHLMDAPYVPAILELVSMNRKDRNWSWSTTLRHMGEIAGALTNLPLSKNIAAIEISRDPHWLAAIRGVAAQSREERPRVPKPITATAVVAAIRAEPRQAVRRLVALTWLACGRTGDCRQLTSKDATLQDSTLTLTFRRGKTIAKRGPYSLHTKLPEEWRPLLSIEDNDTKWIDTIRTASVKDILIALRRIDPSYENRSLRRGALQSLANSGTSEEVLLLFSGHTNVITLRRYLQWGAIGQHKKNVMTQAAEALRAPAEPPQAAGADPVTTTPEQTSTPVPTPPTVRLFDTRRQPTTNYAPHPPPPYIRGGEACQPIPDTHELYRIEYQARNHQAPERWLSFIGKETPPLHELPQRAPAANDSPFVRNLIEDDLPLASKAVAACARRDALLQMITSPELRSYVETTFRWLWDPTRYQLLEDQAAQRSKRKKARCTLHQQDIEKQIELGKYTIPAPSIGQIKRWCRVFAIAERAKKRRRHICEPLTNDMFQETETIRFTSAEDRDKIIAKFKWAITLDFASQYDQFGLEAPVRPYFGIDLGGGTCCTMAVLPMGFRPSAAVGQAATWAITNIEAVARQLNLTFMKDYVVLTYIDNILILANDPETTTTIARLIAERADTAALRVNEIHPPMHSNQVPAPRQRFEFLGRMYDLQKGTIEQSEKTLEKLALIDVAQIQEHLTLTKRQLAAVIGLLLFASNCCAVRNTLFNYYHAFKWYRDEVSGGNVPWDSPTRPMTKTAADTLNDWITTLQQNAPAQLVTEPTNHYTDIMFVDASVQRWAAVLIHRGGIQIHSEEWTQEDHRSWNLESSVASEPLAIRKALCRLVSPTDGTSIHVYTDHEGLVYALSSQCAKGYAYWHLQKFLATFPAPTRFSHIPGLKNPADKFTRGRLEETLVCDPRILDEALQSHHEHQLRGYGEVEPDESWREWRTTVEKPLRRLPHTRSQAG